MLSVPRPVREKKIHGCALLRSLYDREINGTKTRLNIVRATYQTVYPNFSIINVSRPTEFLRKFTPDGRHLIAFSNDLTSIQVYNYLGCSMAVDLLKNYNENRIEKKEGEQDFGEDIIRNEIFQKLFQLKYCIRVSPENETLIKSCSLFTKNGRHALVGSSRVHLCSRRSNIFRPSNEFLNPVLLSPLEDYTLHLVDLNQGSISDTICFKLDKIYFNYNFGVHLFNDTLTILSIFHQTIYIYKIIHDRFCLIRRIGEFCYEDDYNSLSLAHSFINETINEPDMENTIDPAINGLKHKFMVSLYKKAAHETKMGISKNSLGKFYRNFNQYLALRMWRLQLLDDTHLFIRYASEAMATIKIRNPTLKVYTEYFMIYDIETATVLDVFENSSDELLNLYENFCDDFRNPTMNPEGLIPCSLSNNLHARQVYQTFKRKNYEFNGKMRTNKIILNQLPFDTQLFTSSPYLDKSLFNYDDNRVSPIQVPRIALRRPIKFHSKKSGLLSFSLYTGKTTNIRILPPVELNFNNTVEFVFHPTEPFALSIVRKRSRFIINFHIRQVFIPE